MDPRSTATAADLRLQSQWAQRVFEDLITARRASAEMKGVMLQVDKLKPRLREDQPSTLAQAVEVANRANQILKGPEHDTDSGLDSVTRSLTIALAAIEGADRTPPSQVIALYQDSARTLKLRIAEWTGLRDKTLPILNEQLKSLGLSPIQTQQDPAQ